MPTVANKALLLELNVSMVDNNIRRGILQVVANVQSDQSEAVERSKTIEPTANWVFSSLAVNSCTVIRAQNGPVTLVITRPAPYNDTITVKVNSLFVLTDLVGNIQITNPSATKAVLVRVIQM